MPLGRVVQQRGGEEVWIPLPCRTQPRGDVEGVASVGRRHLHEERPRRIGQERAGTLVLAGIDASRQMADELRDPMSQA